MARPFEFSKKSIYIGIMNSDFIRQNLFNWFMRRTTSTAVRRVADLPIAVATDVGNVRTENQDRSAILRFRQSHEDTTIISIVCDGMGGMVDGSICSSLAISTFFSSYIENMSLSFEERVLKSTMEANEAVFLKYNGDGGATLSALVIENQKNILGINVGDSRIYSIEDNKFIQLTTDDTLAGQLAQENGYAYRQNELLQYIGMGPELEPHMISPIKASHSQDILLTSDGAHFVEKQTIELLIKHASDAALAVRRLIEISKWCGGHDNASAIIINLSNIAQESTNAIFGDIEVWDAFGELRLITNSSNSHQKNFSESVPNNKIDQSNLKSIKKIRPKKQSTSSKSDRSRKIKGIKNDKEDLIPAPQLQIDFSDK